MSMNKPQPIDCIAKKGNISKVELLIYRKKE